MKHNTTFSILALLLLAAFSAVLAQDDPRERERYKTGLLPTGTYGGSSLSVNLHNGNLIAGIPPCFLAGAGRPRPEHHGCLQLHPDRAHRPWGRQL